MISIQRPTIPLILTTKGTLATAKLIARVHTSPNIPLTRKDFSAKIYAHHDVKTELSAAQHGKCAFCEAKITHVSYGHIEHYRPKAGYKQSKNDELHKPGYFWLAYTWENLLFSCELCNSRHKGNLFPLANPKSRAKSATDNLADEQPLFVDPASQNPSDVIRFRKHVPFAVKSNTAGKQTIQSLGLKREALNEHRSALLLWIVTMWQTISLLRKSDSAEAMRRLKQAEITLRSAINPNAEYSAMARDYLQSVGFA